MPGHQLLVRPRAAPRRRADRRASVRFAPAQEILCHIAVDDEGLWTRARVCDISSGGVCLLVGRRDAAIGDVYGVELVNGGHTFLCVRRLTVVRVYNGNGSESVIAGEFDEPLSYEELLPFIV